MLARHLLCILGLLVISGAAAWGQDATHQVTGRVVSEGDGLPLPGVNVVVQGTSIGAATDADGGYEIVAPSPNETLVFSFIGFQDQEIPIDGRSVINVTLAEEIGGLDEVVVTGYGSQLKRDVTGAISTVQGENLARVPVESVDKALQGQAAGVQVSSATGVPGSPTRVMIRGTSSISAGTEPLWIVDGMPITNPISGVEGSQGGPVPQNPLAAINPSDIESIEVLKDASATAIYGSRGSNGVIIVTTKSGRQGRSTTRVSIQQSASGLTNGPENMGFVSGPEWMDLVNRARANSGLPPFDPNENLPDFAQLDQTYDTDWFDEILQTGYATELNFSTTRGFEQGSYYISANYLDNTGVLVGNQFQRASLRANLDFQPISSLSIGTRLNLAYTDNNRAKASGGGTPCCNHQIAFGGFGEANAGALPIYPVEVDGELWYPTSGFNLRAPTDRDNLINDNTQYRALGGLFVDFALPWVEGLSLRTEGSFDLLQSNSITWANTVVRDEDSYAFDYDVTSRNFNYNLYGTYIRDFGAHSAELVVGTESQLSDRGWAFVEGAGLSGTAKQVGTPRFPMRVGGFTLGDERYLRAYFSRANYSYRDRYLIGLSVRRDGSSAFADDLRWGTFTAFSAGWIITEEAFLDDFGVLSFLKLRGSFGQTGNQDVPQVTENRYSNWGKYASGQPGDLQNTIGNRAVTWETTTAYDVGLDYELLEGRLSGSVGYYRQDVTDLLLAVPIPMSAGLMFGGDQFWANIGDLRNRGIEFNIEAVPLDFGTFRWRTNFNITTNSNEVLSLSPELDAAGEGINAGMSITRAGGPLGAFYVAEFAGIHPEGGYELIWEIDENGQKTGNKIPATRDNLRDHRILREDQTGLPTFFGGLDNTFSYKGFDLSVLFTFQGGNYIYDEGLRNQSYIGTGTNVLRDDLLGNTWTPENTDAEFPQLRWDQRYEVTGEDGTVSEERFDGGGTSRGLDRFLFRGDYLRLRTLRLGYTFRSLRGINVFVSANNLFTITEYAGWDPEQLEFGGDAQNRNLTQGFAAPMIPQTRTFSAGMSVSF